MITAILAPLAFVARSGLVAIPASPRAGVVVMADAWSYTQLTTAIASKALDVARITPGAIIHVQDKAGDLHDVQLLPTQAADVANSIANAGIDVSFVSASPLAGVFRDLFQWVPILAFAYIAFNTIVGGNALMMHSKMKSSASSLKADNVNTTFADVAGMEAAKEELFEVVSCLKNPLKFAAAGARCPSGVLLEGPPGTGKTLLARAVAGEANVPFFAVTASSFVEMYVGLGAARVRALFEQARKEAPCLVWIDEIDAIGRMRSSASASGGNEERETTLNELLVAMDGFSTDSGIVVMAATNRADILDAALLRPGRFDRRVTITLPDAIERRDILEVHARKVSLEDDVSLANVATMTPGFSGAQLANLINEAALRALRRNATTVSNDDVEDAIDRVVLGLARPDRASPTVSFRVAVHESGHAIVGSALEYDDVSRVSIVPRSNGAGGVTVFDSDESRATSGLYSREYLCNQLAVLLAGRAAEEIVLGAATVSSGASSDLERAYSLATRMITELGMGDVPVAMGKADVGIRQRDAVDTQVAELIQFAYNEAKSIITTQRRAVDALTESLIIARTVSGDFVRDLLQE